ncbi:folate family ECF transporter S component [Brotaphodocola sp.]|uniref:folate family ECF transporter S component n=1 Tax=Brotaphodocola sp. TaxID=3073577 RepID=UPI003D7E1381
MSKMTSLFAGSYREFKNVRTITTAAMFGALSVILGYFTIQIGDYIKIGFSTIVNQFVCSLFGPVVGAVFGGTMDIVKFLIKPTGAFFPGFTLVAIVAGLIYGCFYYKRPLTLWRVLLAELTVCVICNMLMSTYFLSMLYGKGFLALLPMRAFKNLIMWPINSILFYTVRKMLESAGVVRLVKGHV